MKIVRLAANIVWMVCWMIIVGFAIGAVYMSEPATAVILTLIASIWILMGGSYERQK